MLQRNLETIEHAVREARITSSAFLFCNPATLIGNTPLAFGYMPVRPAGLRGCARSGNLAHPD